MLLLLPFILFIPVVIYALEKISIEIDANIEIEPSYPMFALRSCQYNPNEKTFYFRYDEGSTWEDYLASSFDFNAVDEIRYAFEFGNEEIIYYTEEMDACVQEVEYQAWHSNMTEEELEKSERFFENYDRCEELYSTEYRVTDSIINRSDNGYYRMACYK